MSNFELIKPFGPIICKYSLPETLVEELNYACDLVSADEDLSKRLDYSNQLAGKVRQELQIPSEVLVQHYEWLNEAVSKYIVEVSAIEDVTAGRPIQDLGDTEFISKWSGAWFVRSFAGDYNPLHNHPDAELASFGFLKLPDWDEELDEDARDHAGVTHGCTMLSYGDMNRMSTKLYTIRPKVGDFYIFPAWLSHMVYPFRTAGERRSFSINFSYARKK